MDCIAEKYRTLLGEGPKVGILILVLTIASVEAVFHEPLRHFRYRYVIPILLAFSLSLWDLYFDGFNEFVFYPIPLTIMLLGLRYFVDRAER